MTNSCWLRVSTFAHPNDFDATFSLWKSRGDHPLAFGIDIIVINSSKTINMTLGLQQQSREPIIVEVCQPLQRSLHKSYPQQFHLHVSRRWEFQVALCQQSPSLASLSCHRMASFTFRSVNPPKCVPIMVAINHTAGEMIIIHWAEMRLLGIVTPNLTIISVTSRCEVPIYSDIHLQFCSLAHNWLVVYLPLWKICSSVGKIIKMFQTTNQIMNYH